MTTPLTDVQLILKLMREREELSTALLDLADQFAATHAANNWMPQVTKNMGYANARALLARIDKEAE